MDVAATLTSKGQITVPKSVRDALGLTEGDDVLFRVEGSHAVIAKIPDFLDLAGSISIPPDIADNDWSTIEQIAEHRAGEWT